MAAAVPTKVFVGNLSFKTRDADLARAFEAAGKVTAANIITRGPRSLGYGFVELSSAEEAEQAIIKLNKSDLDGRQINVEIARPREQTSQDVSTSPGANTGRPRQRRRRPQRPAGAATTGAPATTAPAAGGDGVSAAPAATSGGSLSPARTRRPRRVRAAGGASAAPTAGASGSAPAPSTTTAAPAGQADGTADDGRRPARRGRGGRRYGRYPRYRRQRTDEQPRIPSTTTLFVANLHYQIDNEGLATIFKDHNPVKAYVVQTNSGRSRGFGFVEFANEPDQQNALKSIDKKVVSERPLSVKVSQVRAPQSTSPSAEAAKN